MNHHDPILEKKIAYHFSNPALLQTALTHSSAGQNYNYERLEFLGDRVLGLIVASLLYNTFPREPEGHLAKRLAALVQGPFLAKIAREINLGDHIQFSDSERSAGGAENDNILADVFEALVGALYLDGGFIPCEKLIHTLWDNHLHDMKAPPQHPKTTLQEWTQKQALGLPLYEVAGQDGPDHAPTFKIRLTIADFDPVIGEGRSRQEAEKKAAKAFLKKLQAQN